VTALDQRQRLGLTLVMLVYLVGYLTGRAGGQVDAARRLMDSYARASGA
jgi:hypothetical protein